MLRKINVINARTPMAAAESCHLLSSTIASEEIVEPCRAIKQDLQGPIYWLELPCFFHFMGRPTRPILNPSPPSENTLQQGRLFVAKREISLKPSVCKTLMTTKAVLLDAAFSF